MTETNKADRILWRAWHKKRDDAVFADLVRPHLRFAADFARRLGLHDADADDLVQQALAALAAETSDRPVDVGLRPWLGRFLVLHAKMLRRAGARRAKHERAAPPPAPGAVADYESREAVEALLGELPEPQRQAVVLRFLHDLDYEDVAHVTGVSVNACRIRVHRGIERMRAKAGDKVGALVAALPLLHGRGEAALMGGAAKAATGVLLMKKIAAVLLLLCAAGAGVLLYQGRDSGKAATPRADVAKNDPPPAPPPEPEPERVEEKAPKNEPPRRPAAHDRDRVLRAVFAAGGTVGFAADGEHLHFFKSDDHLPDGPVTAVMLRNGKPKAVLPLRVLRIHDTKVTEAAAPMIARIATLERLRFENKSMSDAVLEHLGRLPRLVHLEARDIRVTAEGLRHLEGMRSLRKLQLERLESGALAGVEKLTQLEELELDEAGVTGEDLRYLAGLKNLRRLNLGETKVDGRNLRYLAELQRLERLELDETRLDDESLAHLANLRGLKLLRLDETGITSKGVKYLAGLTALERLDLDENRIGDEAVEHLLGLVNLKHLDLKDTEVTAEGIARLRRALPDCRIRMSE